MPDKPEFIKIKLKEIHEKIDILCEPDKIAEMIYSPNVKAKSLSHVKNKRTAGPSFQRKTQTAYLKSSDYAKQ